MLTIENTIVEENFLSNANFVFCEMQNKLNKQRRDELEYDFHKID